MAAERLVRHCHVKRPRASTSSVPFTLNDVCPARRTCATTHVPASPVVVPVMEMRPARRPLPARPTIVIVDAARVVLAPVPVEEVCGVPAAGSDGAGVGAAVAVKVVEVALGALTRLYDPAWDGAYVPVPAPFASTVTVNVLIEASGAVT